jgi:preprotein translocase subunit YajC
VKSVGPLIWVVLLAGVFYLMIIRPNRNRQRAQQQMNERLGIGARVMTTSGLFAEVVGFDDDAILLETAPGVTMRWSKAAVARILPEPDADDDSEDSVPDVDERTDNQVAADSDPADPDADDPDADDPDAADPDSANRPT